MSDSKEGISEDSNENEAFDSRRNFLKASVAVGATAAVLATGAHLIPTVGAAAKSIKNEADKTAFTTPNSKEPLVVSIQGDNVDVYQGETKVPLKDPSLARQITSTVKSKI
jgi:hypothetical protein